MPEYAKILVIDDESVIRDGCTKILTKEGWTVDTAENGKDGLAFMGKEEYDIILLDLMMPGMSGLDVLREAEGIAPDAYIIVITGYASIETAVEAMKMGAFDYVPKPFTPDQLRMVTRKAMENKALKLEAQFLRQEQEKGLLAIAHEKSKIKTILDCMPDGVLVLDEDKRIALYNPMAKKLLALEDENIIGVTVEECVNCDDLSRMITEALQECGEDSKIRGEVVGNNAIPIMAQVAPVKMEDGRTAGAVAILQDITAQKTIERMKGEFIAKVTHELRAPISTINQLLMTLQEGVCGELEETQLKMIERAKLWGEGLLELISDLLNISKIESGRAIQNMAPVQINTLVNDVVELLKPQADGKKITIEMSLEKSLPTIKADSDGMKEVFTNLIGNAIKYSESGGSIKITAGISDGRLSASITDDGFGINEKDLQHIFDRFYRVKNEKTRHIVGTGLGLPIVKEIVEAHNGSISVSSAEGKGSTFTVTLPIDNPDKKC